MNKQFLVAALGAALALPASLAAQADGVMGGTDFTVYGRVVAGIDRQDTDVQGESATWNLGAVGFDGTGAQESRIGFSGERDLGGGMSAGFRLEQGWDRGGDATNSGPNNGRHRYVYLDGGFGSLHFGNTNTPFANTNYDQANFLGGSFRSAPDRREGIHYANTIGNFSFGLSVTGNNGDSRATETNTARLPAITNAQAVAARESDTAFLARVQAAARRAGLTFTGAADVAGTSIRNQNTGESAEDYATHIRTQVNALTTYTGTVENRETLMAAGTRLALAAGHPEATAADANGVVGRETDAALRMRAVDTLADGSGLKGAALATYRAGLAQQEGELDTAYAARLLMAARNTEASRNARIADEDIDRIIIGAGYDFGAFAVNVAYDGDNTDTDRDYTAVRVNGAVGPLSYWVGYAQQDDARPGGENDHSAIGLFLGFSASENDLFYMEYESLDDDQQTGFDASGVPATNEDATATVLGYSRTLGGGAIFSAEYRSRDNDAANAPDPSRLALAMIVNF